MQKREAVSIPDLVKFIAENGLDKDPRVMALLKTIAVEPDNVERQSQLMRLIRPRLIYNLLKEDPFRPYPEQGEVDGPIRLGLCNETGSIFGLFPEELMQGTIIIGRPGAGKTTFTYNLIQAANRLGINSLILDIKKDYRHLIRKIPNTLVFRADSKDFRWNPLEQPEGVDRVSHITNFADITAEAHAIYDGTNNYIVEHLNWLYTRNPLPTLFDLYNVIKHHKPALISRTSRYKESAENRLASILVKMGNAFKHRRGYRIEKLIDDYNIVIELDNLGSKGCIYVSSLILSHIFQYRIANNLRGIKQKPAFVIIDEANEIFDKNLERKLGGLTLVSMAREAREFQLGIVSSCQVPDAISDTVKNVYTRVLLNLAEGANLKNMALSMGLTPEQQAINYQLKTGQAIVRLADKYPKPFAVLLPKYDIAKNVTDAEIKQHMQPFIREFDSKAEKQERQEEPVMQQVPAIEDKKAEEQIKAEEKSFLTDIYNRPFLTITERYKALNLSAGKGTALVKKLIRKGLLDLVEINLGGRGGLSKFLALSKQACKLIGMPEKTSINKSNFEHSSWQNRISTHFSKKYKTTVERNIKGKRIDVAIETGKGITAIEVALTSAYEKQNIIKDLEAGCEKVIIACKDRKVFEAVNNIKAGLEAEKQEKVEVCLLQEVVNLNLKDLITNP